MRAKDKLGVDNAQDAVYVTTTVVASIVGRQGVSWDDVTKPDGAESDEAEVGPIQEPPALPLTKEQGSPADVRHHDCQAEGNGDSDVVDAHRDLLGRRLYFCSQVFCPNVSFQALPYLSVILTN